MDEEVKFLPSLWSDSCVSFTGRGSTLIVSQDYITFLSHLMLNIVCPFLFFYHSYFPATFSSDRSVFLGYLITLLLHFLIYFINKCQGSPL